MNSQTASLFRRLLVLVLVVAQLLTPLTVLAQPSTAVMETSFTDRQTGEDPPVEDPADVEESRFTAYAHDYDKTVDKGHGRIEVRHCWTISDPQLIRCLRGADRFRNLQTVIRVRAERYIGDEHSVEERYFIGSATTHATEALRATRTHWQVENSLHWILDIAFREDDSRIRKGNGAQNFAVLRHIALNALKQETTAKLGIKNKRLEAGWNEDYLLTVLGHLTI
jgi:predicted transposase YbfD/YdcC